MEISKLKRLLIVDDEPSILFAYKRLFRSHRLAVDTAGSYQDAVDLLQQHRYLLVITDLRLDLEDEQGGIRLINAIRNMDPDVKIVLATAYGSPEIEKDSIEVGADYYMEKPLVLDTIRELVERLLKDGDGND